MKDKINILLENPKKDDILKFDGQNWINCTFEDFSFIPSELTDLSDVLIRNVKSNQYLKYDGTGWINAPLDIDLSFLENNLEDLDLKTDTLEADLIGVSARVEDLEKNDIFFSSKIEFIEMSLKNLNSQTLSSLVLSDYSFFKNITLDYSLGGVIKTNIKSSKVTWNFINIPKTNGVVNNITVIVDSHFNNIYGNECSVNGISIGSGIKWAGGSAPSASNNIDIINFTIITDNIGNISVFGYANTNFS